MITSKDRFVVVTHVGPDAKLVANLIILADYKFWSDHTDELVKWCEENNATQAGMTVTCDDVSLTAFALRWS